ncbi:MAG: hypothetical protein U0794_21265 [Isosphaeraceae bacterium]
MGQVGDECRTSLRVAQRRQGVLEVGAGQGVLESRGPGPQGRPVGLRTDPRNHPRRDSCDLGVSLVEQPSEPAERFNMPPTRQRGRRHHDQARRTRRRQGLPQPLAITHLPDLVE